MLITRQSRRITWPRRSGLTSPDLEGPIRAEVTLVGWGSTWGVIHEAVERLAEAGITANHVQLKCLHPFQAEAVADMLSGGGRIVVVENNSSGQFARYLRAETGLKANDTVLKNDGEPFTPGYIVEAVQAILEGRPRSLDVTEDEAREIVYHYIHIKLGDDARPVAYEQVTLPGYDEPLWLVTTTSKSE